MKVYMANTLSVSPFVAALVVFYSFVLPFVHFLPHFLLCVMRSVRGTEGGVCLFHWFHAIVTIPFIFFFSFLFLFTRFLLLPRVFIYLLTSIFFNFFPSHFSLLFLILIIIIIILLSFSTMHFFSFHCCFFVMTLSHK
ncbi:hypothetical protein, unlikely [Trypanosoma brucei gambiense DAL972]|uniref:Uncharacterized protein n=1 Tax=Trypanosoma brucei gambiense (strain MHOM/CI/86/DAL972) TaxID=679716 RepID=D0AA63_TRYB9|nr:hypothetical protein, unlikely [Trypanosoma brucei gambiense DAL972]CBH18564.1 hypothetical protein, unlikely [Trypanosoma brucei gambiense DAL972]|eukprot:XP_011780828.1 hypothetical protein, unlikely [Trypanosoma brucei gambiense DAL972]